MWNYWNNYSNFVENTFIRFQHHLMNVTTIESFILLKTQEIYPLVSLAPEIFYALELVLAIDDQKGPDSNYYPCRTKHTEPSIHPFSVALIQEWERKVTECWKRWDWKHRLWLDSCDVRLNYFKWFTDFHLEENIVFTIAHSIFY